MQSVPHERVFSVRAAPLEIHVGCGAGCANVLALRSTCAIANPVTLRSPAVFAPRSARMTKSPSDSCGAPTGPANDLAFVAKSYCVVTGADIGNTKLSMSSSYVKTPVVISIGDEGWAPTLIGVIS